MTVELHRSCLAVAFVNSWFQRSITCYQNCSNWNSFFSVVWLCLKAWERWKKSDFMVGLINVEDPQQMAFQKTPCFYCCCTPDWGSSSDFYSWVSLWILHKCSINQLWEVLNLQEKLQRHCLALPNVCFCIKLTSACPTCAFMSLQNSICVPKAS